MCVCVCVCCYVYVCPHMCVSGTRRNCLASCSSLTAVKKATGAKHYISSINMVCMCDLLNSRHCDVVMNLYNIMYMEQLLHIVVSCDSTEGGALV